MHNVDLKAVLTGVKPGGCVQPYLEGFAAELTSAGYALLPIRDYLRSAAHLGRWMDSHNLEINQLKERVIAKFARHDCECPFAKMRGRRPSRRYVARTRRFAEYLGRLAVVPPLALSLSKVVPPPLVGFHAWMTQYRGIKSRTVKGYEKLIEEMLPSLGCNPDVYDAAHVRKALARKVNQLSRSYAKSYVSALRAFLRFLAAQGRCRPHLDRAVLAVPEWKLSALPRYLEKDAIERIITSCDLSKPLGVRDRAILLLLVRLGLRAGDITAMRLDDIDWNAGTVRVLGKGRSEEHTSELQSH